MKRGRQSDTSLCMNKENDTNSFCSSGEQKTTVLPFRH